LTAIKQLAGQTLWYGVSNIGAKFLNYLLTPLLTYLMTDISGVRDYGDYSLLYCWIAVANIIFTYGFETGYFRFSNKGNYSGVKLAINLRA
jgi:O-antigen/teichoic acid export membrane protein